MSPDALRFSSWEILLWLPGKTVGSSLEVLKVPPSLPGRDAGRGGPLLSQRDWGLLGEAVGWIRSQGGSLASCQRNLEQGGAWGRARNFLLGEGEEPGGIGSLEGWASLGEAAGSGWLPGTRLWQAPEASRGGWHWLCCGWGGESCELTPCPFSRAEPPGSTPTYAPSCPPCAVECCGHRDGAPAVPPTLGKAGQGGEDRWAWGAGSSLPALCLWPCLPELPFLLREGTACRQVCLLRKAPLPSRGFSSFFQVCSPFLSAWIVPALPSCWDLPTKHLCP